MYFRSLCYGYALNCHFVCLAIPGTRPLFVRKQNLLFYLYEITKNEIYTCLNKHETGLIYSSKQNTEDDLKPPGTLVNYKCLGYRLLWSS